MIATIEKAIFTPHSTAVVGASNANGKMGHLFIKNLLAHYPGRLYPIHPHEQQICGLPAYPTVASLPNPVDLLILLVPHDEALRVVEACPPGQARALLVIPSGFGEVSAEGRERQQALLTTARARGLRVIGPNSLGLFNAPAGLNASMVPALPPGGPGLSCVTQSGGWGMAVYMYAVDHGMSVAKFCDLGNTADVDIAELLDIYRFDEETRVVGAFLEAIVDEPAFVDAARRLAAEKPLILSKAGRSAAGQRASQAHLGRAAAQPDIPATAVPGVIRADTGLDLLEIAKGLSWQPLPQGRRVAIVTGSGGIGAELADLCEGFGLTVPPLSPRLQAALRPHLPAYASVQNPVDLTPIWRRYPVLYPPLLELLMASDEIDIILATIIDVASTVRDLMIAVADCVTKAQSSSRRNKPVYIYWASPPGLRAHRQLLQAAHVPCYSSTRTTVQVAAALADYAMAGGRHL